MPSTQIGRTLQQLCTLSMTQTPLQNNWRNMLQHRLQTLSCKNNKSLVEEQSIEELVKRKQTCMECRHNNILILVLFYDRDGLKKFVNLCKLDSSIDSSLRFSPDCCSYRCILQFSSISRASCHLVYNPVHLLSRN